VNPSHAGDVAATFCATLVDQWVACGVRHAVVCPGSRSTPMALALVRDGRIHVEVHHDERAAAFLALGVGVATGVPAVVLTTSGTAAVELHPAVVEAHHAQVPLLVVTADRPPWLHGVGAPQTIDQRQLYGVAVRGFFDPGVPDAADADAWRVLANDTFSLATAGPPGPVHLNLAFDEPLVGDPGGLPAPVDPPRAPDRQPDAATVGHLATTLAGRRGVVVAAGPLNYPDSVLALAGALGWPVVADARSGCRVSHPAVIAHFDGILRHPDVARHLAPDVVLRLGALPASKVLGAWLDGLEAHQIGVHAHGQRIDPGGSLDELVAAEPGVLCDAVARTLLSGPQPPSRPPHWLATWRGLDDAVAHAYGDVLAGHDTLVEPVVAQQVLAAAAPGSHVVVSSSMPVRDLEWYAAARDGVTVVSNRGANGIDGVVSTAVGVALGSSAPVVVLVGDVAMLHDTNALLGLATRDVTVTVVVVDNDGGGIFSFLPQATRLPPAQFEQLFGTPHGVDLVALAGAHGLNATTVTTPAALAGAIGAGPVGGGCQVVVVPSDRAANVGVHDALHAAAATAIDASGVLESA